MPELPLPAELGLSFSNCSDYPANLIVKGTSNHRSTLSSYKKRLDDAESKLCLVPDTDDVDQEFEVHFRDLKTADGKDVDKKNVHSPDGVARWLGTSFTPSSVDSSQRIATFSKRDPKCRFIYLYAENSRDKLKVTREVLVQILTFHQVMPLYLDFMFIFGAQSNPKDLRFSGFRERTMMRDPARGLPVPSLGRSGRNFQISYNLKGVTFKSKGNESMRLDEWSIRQAAIYHQFDIVFGTTLWIVTKGRLDIQQRYKELTGPDGRAEDKSFDSLEDCFRSTLAAHLLYCHWSTEDWRWYIRWLEDVIDEESSMVVYGPRGPGYAHREYKPYHIQDLQYWQDKTNEAVMVLEANVGVISALRKFYANLREHKDFPAELKNRVTDDIISFAAHLDEIIDDFNMQISRAKLLAGITNDRKELVVQHLQGQVAERTERLNLNLEREAIVMRIITIVTLVYLPATFVSTFFSTDIVKYQDQGDGNGAPGNGTFSAVAMRRWIQVTLPLTALTLVVAYSTYKIAEHTRQGVKLFEHSSQANNPAQRKAKTRPTSSSQQRSNPGLFRGLTRRLSALRMLNGASQAKASSLPLHETSKAAG
ncbi:hypothetical protein EV356DRAFT_508130 [Viridothelium virens]|uniref:CorA-like transporter domain-containing protein n=1 Tax=Viridothelium virens TaxID=1048519 RepID=A0A6A6GYJ6_VIRVR|nr:hypothetical protein EV356DRAFT_508130 [Viridothelium virens]